MISTFILLRCPAVPNAILMLHPICPGGNKRTVQHQFSETFNTNWAWEGRRAVPWGDAMLILPAVSPLPKGLPLLIRCTAFAPKGVFMSHCYPIRRSHSFFPPSRIRSHPRAADGISCKLCNARRRSTKSSGKLRSTAVVTWEIGI